MFLSDLKKMEGVSLSSKVFVPYNDTIQMKEGAIYTCISRLVVYSPSTAYGIYLNIESVFSRY